MRRTAILTLLVCTGCSSEPPPQETPPAPATPVPVAPPQRFLDDGDTASLRAAVAQSLSWLRVQKKDRALRFAQREITAGELRDALEEFDGMLEDDPAPELLRSRVKERFEFVEHAPEATDPVLVTGYYEPMYKANLKRTKRHRFPIYTRPGDMLSVELKRFDEEVKRRRAAGRLDKDRVLPYFSRKEIDRDGALAGRGLELAWLENPLDPFFLAVQGSGTLILPSGKKVRVGYAGANGRPYRSIGRLLVDEGKITKERISMQSIRAYLDSHPEDLERVLDHNPSYVFFRRLDGAPVGNLNRPLTPMRSIATDHRVVPPAALGFLVTEHPTAGDDGTIGSGGPLTRFVLNQDTGGAIKGAGRVDLFWGRGLDAERSAGLMQHSGRLFLLLPKRPPRAGS